MIFLLKYSSSDSSTAAATGTTVPPNHHPTQLPKPIPVQLKLVTSLLLTMLTGTVLAQTPVTLEGLKRTQNRYLTEHLPELHEDAHGQLFLIDSLADLPTLRQRLLNLPPFSDAELDSRNDTLRIRIRRARTIYPLLGFGGVRNNVYWQVGVHDFHFRGIGQQITAYYQNNAGEHNFLLFHRNPMWRGRWGYAATLRRYAAVEPVHFSNATVNYRYTNHDAGVALSHRLATRSELEFGGSVFRENYRKNEPESDLPGPDELQLDKLLLKLSLLHDRRDYHYERQGGTLLEASAQTVLNFSEGTPFSIAFLNLRHFRLVGPRGNLAGRVRLGLSTNENSPFAPFVLDSQLNIRGSGNRIDRGTAQFVFNLEYRHTLWRDARNNFVVQGVAFSDFGSWRNPGGAFRDLTDPGTFTHFVGGGLRLISNKAKNAGFRLDYGVDRTNGTNRGFVFGVGQYF